MSGSERRRELRRRRHRKKQIARLSARVGKASAGEKQDIARKIRELTPGADELLARLKIK